MPDYPKVLILNDNTVVLSRPAESKDVNGIYNFFKKIHRSDLLIYQYDVGDIEKIDTWFTASLYKKLFQLVTLKNDEIIAKCTLHQEGIYWQNSAEIKLIIRPDFRGRGLGTQLFNILLYEGLKRNLRKSKEPLHYLLSVKYLFFNGFQLFHNLLVFWKRFDIFLKHLNTQEH